jgi:type I restriction enzyme, S subunit
MATDSPVGHPSDWPVVQLSDIALKIGSGSTPRGGEEAYLSRRSKFALVRSQNVFDRHFDTSGLAFISDEQAAGLKGVVLQSRDLLLNITGDGVTFSRCCMIPSEVLPACVNQHVAIIRVKQDEADPGYVLSYLTHPATKSYIESFNAGGSRRAITKGHIESFLIALPPLTEQRAIARILDTLDAKIELNQRMNETLQGMAQALFKSWFVDFDPVHARAEGRDPGVPKSRADLFPGSFNTDGVPLNWARTRFSETVEIIGGGTPKTSVADYWSGEIPWFSVVDAPRETDVWVIETEKKITQAGVDNSSTRILPERTTIISARGTVGKVALVGVPMAMNQSCYGLRGLLGKWGTFTYFSTCQLVSLLQQRAHGSVFDTITRESFAGVDVSVPPDTVIMAFEEIVESMLQRIRTGLFESRTLANLRDVLLPKLISGELRLSNVERIAGGQI